MCSVVSYEVPSPEHFRLKFCLHFCTSPCLPNVLFNYWRKCEVFGGMWVLGLRIPQYPPRTGYIFIRRWNHVSGANFRFTAPIFTTSFWGSVRGKFLWHFAFPGWATDTWFPSWVTEPWIWPLSSSRCHVLKGVEPYLHVPLQITAWNFGRGASVTFSLAAYLCSDMLFF